MLSTVSRFAKVKIHGRGINEVIEAKAGENIFKVCFEKKIPIPTSCEGHGACGSCHAYVEKGMDLFSPPLDAEYDTLDFAYNVKDNSRLICHLKLTQDDGDASLFIPDLPK